MKKVNVGEQELLMEVIEMIHKEDKVWLCFTCESRQYYFRMGLGMAWLMSTCLSRREEAQT